MTAAQIRAARALLDWKQAKLALESGISVETIKRLEAMDGPIDAAKVATLNAITKAFAKAGVEFTNGDEPGVKFTGKKKR